MIACLSKISTVHRAVNRKFCLSHRRNRFISPTLTHRKGFGGHRARRDDVEFHVPDSESDVPPFRNRPTCGRNVTDFTEPSSRDASQRLKLQKRPATRIIRFIIAFQNLEGRASDFACGFSKLSFSAGIPPLEKHPQNCRKTLAENDLRQFMPPPEPDDSAREAQG